MSRVTNVILTAHVGPHSESDLEIAAVNSYLRQTFLLPGTLSSHQGCCPNSRRLCHTKCSFTMEWQW